MVFTGSRGPQSITVAPGYSLHRDTIAAVDDSTTTADKFRGINTSDHARAHVQVVPSAGATPQVEVMWWSEAAAKFVSENPKVQKTGPAAGAPFEFDVECGGRIMLVAVTALDANETVSVHVGGHGVAP